MTEYKGKAKFTFIYNIGHSISIKIIKFRLLFVFREFKLYYSNSKFLITFRSGA